MSFKHRRNCELKYGMDRCACQLHKMLDSLLADLKRITRPKRKKKKAKVKSE